MSKLMKKSVWLPSNVVRHLGEVARRRGTNVETIVEEAVSPYVEADEGQSVWPVTIDAEDERRLRQGIAELCSDEPEVDITEEVPKWLGTMIVLGIENNFNTS
jgi:predicted transcriptional regulator